MRDEVAEKTEDEMTMGKPSENLTWDGTRGEEEMAEQKRGKKMNLWELWNLLKVGPITGSTDA